MESIFHIPRYKLVITLLALGFVLFLSACSAELNENTVLDKAVELENGDECHLCGMIITAYPGPKGQLSERSIEGNLKFCSTRDMFAYLLDPEHTHNIKSVFVHDMEVNPWEAPSEETYIDGREAWYVLGSNKTGAMGPTLASFARQAAAEEFSAQFGGEVLQFEDIKTGKI